MNVSPMQIQSMQPNLQMQQQMQFSGKQPENQMNLGQNNLPQQPINLNQLQNMKNPYG